MAASTAGAAVRAIDVTFNFSGGDGTIRARRSPLLFARMGFATRDYFDDDFMLRRLDYVPDVLGGVAAHSCYDPVTTNGLIFPTLRRVVRRTPEGPLLSGRTSFILDHTDLVIRG